VDRDRRSHQSAAGRMRGSLPARERPMKMFSLLRREKVAEVRDRIRGHFPSGPAANQECSFILLHNSADKRSEVVSGERRGGGKIKSGVRGPESGLGASSGCATRSPLAARNSPLATRHSSVTSRALDLLPYPESRVPYPGSPPLATCYCLSASGNWSARARCRAEQRSAWAQRCWALRPPPGWRERARRHRTGSTNRESGRFPLSPEGAK